MVKRMLPAPLANATGPGSIRGAGRRLLGVTDQAGETVTYPGAHRPDRTRWVSSTGLRLAVYEWGPPDARPIVMAHGGFDFAGTFDVFAPLLV